MTVERKARITLARLFVWLLSNVTDQQTISLSLVISKFIFLLWSSPWKDGKSFGSLRLESAWFMSFGERYSNRVCFCFSMISDRRPWSWQLTGMYFFISIVIEESRWGKYFCHQFSSLPSLLGAFLQTVSPFTLLKPGHTVNWQVSAV